ncbi:MAG: hypothetical protein PHD04_04885 [Candidatus Pacebacteria bacterium]|nr:hypothetical protein [Candidatus Paceibacterota bacterium]
MDFESIKNKIKEVRMNLVRIDGDANFEAVVLQGQMGGLTACLEGLFGKPEYPSKNQLSAQIKKAIDPFGGIMPGQTLYYRSQDQQTIFAMLWPWNNGQSTTLKLARV